MGVIGDALAKLKHSAITVSTEAILAQKFTLREKTTHLMRNFRLARVRHSSFHPLTPSPHIKRHTASAIHAPSVPVASRGTIALTEMSVNGESLAKPVIPRRP